MYFTIKELRGGKRWSKWATGELEDNLNVMSKGEI